MEIPPCTGTVHAYHHQIDILVFDPWTTTNMLLNHDRIFKATLRGHYIGLLKCRYRSSLLSLSLEPVDLPDKAETLKFR